MESAIPERPRQCRCDDNRDPQYQITTRTPTVGCHLLYGCSDVEIDDTGAWIDNFQYDHYNPGTLMYTVTAKPSSAHNVPGGAHKVSLLALRPVTLGLPVK